MQYLSVTCVYCEIQKYLKWHNWFETKQNIFCIILPDIGSS